MHAQANMPCIAHHARKGAECVAKAAALRTPSGPNLHSDCCLCMSVAVVRSQQVTKTRHAARAATHDGWHESVTPDKTRQDSESACVSAGNRFRPFAGERPPCLTPKFPLEAFLFSSPRNTLEEFTKARAAGVGRGVQQLLSFSMCHSNLYVTTLAAPLHTPP